MKCEVYDTYVTRDDDVVMHFDIIVPTGTGFEEVLTFGRQYMAEVGQAKRPLSTAQCRFCHIESATQEVASSIQKQGYYILAMEGCPSAA